MSSNHYTINCDLGEGISTEASIIPFVDVASVACGGHFGNHETIRETLVLIKQYGKKAGAHPSYPDRENFGRKSLEINANVLIQSLNDQISLFFEVAEKQEMSCDHIKFHGALYNDAAENPDLSLILVDFLKHKFPQIPLFVPPHSELRKAALESGLPVRSEIFGDRAYLKNYKLVNRSVENSLFTRKNQVISHLEEIVNHGRIRIAAEEYISIAADTICFHGDNPGILEFLPFVRNQFWK